MANVDHVQKDSFLCSLRAVTEAIAEILSTSRSASVNTHWKIWSAFCANVALDPLFLSYKDYIPILTTFSNKYHCGDIGASSKND